ncbi:hypothetical protein [Thiohalomonas denitrificans]|uniref:Roadblock/LAMTOR2 domain-containing protein n=1 Tax=Thiohalomonas denitrificans TaxID=415747 RepID=A0A1G5QD59_9GAMM|nr:hypothetical protein [Thiohalomonas denitrificans]SCZ59301.1 hypothetical protein SAMN03097708_01834 [Thiohalomonas denitrificans]
MANDLNAALQASVASIPECLAAGYVDLSTGMLLDIRTVDSHPNEVLELLAAATADLFQGQNVQTIENLFKRSRGLPENDGHHYFQEMIINSDNLIHIFLRGKTNPEHVVTFVCRLSANLGMVLTKARSSMPSIENAL